jgi:hypothetical protein
MGITEQREVNGERKLVIYPAKDERILRIIRKSVRGLTYIHNGTPLPDERIWADVLRWALPADMEEQLRFQGNEPDIVEYAFLERVDPELDAVWVFRFYGRTEFIATVSAGARHPARISL